MLAKIEKRPFVRQKQCPFRPVKQPLVHGEGNTFFIS